MTREEAINEIKSWDFLNKKESEAVRTLITELHESEDERIRKQLISICDEWLGGGYSARPCLNDVKWLKNLLEKQKEQKHPNGCFTCDEYKKGYEAGRLNGFTAGYNKAMKEQKHDWSEEERKILDSIIDDYEKAAKSFCGYAGKIWFLKAIRDGEYNLPNPTECSPDSVWKPTEEQMDYLSGAYATAVAENDEKAVKAFGSLHDDLTKMMLKDGVIKGFNIGGKPVDTEPYSVNISTMNEWSEEDEEMFRIISNRIEKFDEWATEQGYPIDDPTMKQSPIAWFKSLPERFNLQPKQECSEEDERIKRIRKAILANYKGDYHIPTFNGVTREDCIAYLENEKDNKFAPRVLPCSAAWFEDGEEKQKEQEPTDLPPGFYFIGLDGKRYYSKEFRYGDMKMKVVEQKPVARENDFVSKPAEWSEEDERMLSRCEKSIESSKQFADSDTFKKAKDNEIDWLENRFKSLRPSWKPSVEQMKALEQAKISAVAGNYITKDGLCSLYEQLKKLM